MHRAENSLPGHSGQSPAVPVPKPCCLHPQSFLRSSPNPRVPIPKPSCLHPQILLSPSPILPVPIPTPCCPHPHTPVPSGSWQPLDAVPASPQQHLPALLTIPKPLQAGGSSLLLRTKAGSDYWPLLFGNSSGTAARGWSQSRALRSQGVPGGTRMPGGRSRVSLPQMRRGAGKPRRQPETATRVTRPRGRRLRRLGRAWRSRFPSLSPSQRSVRGSWDKELSVPSAVGQGPGQPARGSAMAARRGICRLVGS